METEHCYQGQLVEGLVTRIRSGEDISVIDSNDIWGGMGSVGDCSMFTGDESNEVKRKNELELCDLLIRVAELMIFDGVGTARIKSRKESFEWRRAEISVGSGSYPIN